MIKFVLLSSLFLASCVQNSQFKSVEPNFIFHDNSSKLWLINHLYKKGKDYAPLSLKYKQILVFHSSGNCYQYEMRTLGELEGQKSVFTLTNEGKNLQLQFEKEKWLFDVSYLSAEKIILKPSAKAKNEFQIELIPFPEF